MFKLSPTARFMAVLGLSFVAAHAMAHPKAHHHKHHSHPRFRVTRFTGHNLKIEDRGLLHTSYEKHGRVNSNTVSFIALSREQIKKSGAHLGDRVRITNKANHRTLIGYYLDKAGSRRDGVHYTELSPHFARRLGIHINHLGHPTTSPPLLIEVLASVSHKQETPQPS